MKSQWFYGRGADVSGPVSDRQLFDLAADGKIIPTDTIWRDDVEAGVPAAKVKHLFQIAESSAVALPANSGPADTIPVESPQAESTPVVEETPVASVPFPVIQAPPPKPARATAGTGAVIVGQDGKTVKYRGKCTTCDREDTSWRSMAIPRGMMRASFFCGKCRKRREIEIHGYH